MRALVLALLVALAGCRIEQVDALAGDDSGAFPECASAADCVLAASTCCGCPEFAMPEMGWEDGCEDVACPMPGDCPAIEPACVEGRCTTVTACDPVTCDMSCPGGFASDAAGCLECVCGEGTMPPASCFVDGDCVEVAADCCGCTHGGTDTAVPAASADDLADALMCPDSPACPGVDVCDPSAAPRCVGGSCMLVGDASACGRPDLPMCPEGTVCVLNADPDDQSQGVGTCQPAV